ncbi:SIMPL domain-containing protein [Pontibacter sp. HSC-14F20]|uniref:SIMPL domain-containing protein n=1 Tax=Pontibacter sp. HSC-14F20 TaxID=2864136 RepID=UPI001C72A8F9|nr:SIMPL domain-containing protein [Pontibacter sp. HSC-14F20]MBX0331971.1 SIMPL domain-containing protein [Pontibacter sp. HSC-14F20]
MKRKLQITGRGKLSVTPDLMILSFSASAQEWEYDKTVDALNAKVEELRNIIEAQGIARSNLKTKDFGVRKETQWNRKTEKPDFIGYSASHRMELELPLDKALINKLLGQIARHMDDLDFSISFGVKDASDHQQQLILQAITKAKENAALIAEATGVELREILDIDYSYRELTIRSQQHDYAVYDSQVLMEASAPAPDIEPDDIDVAETVTITWRIG